MSAQNRNEEQAPQQDRWDEPFFSYACAQRRIRRVRRTRNRR